MGNLSPIGEISSVLSKAHDTFFLNQNQLLTSEISLGLSKSKILWRRFVLVLFSNYTVFFAGMKIGLPHAPLTLQ